ncbi:MAG: hypothetical protein K8U03_06425 [Planctomycetia bacterium]|nr:hypothetical protein [Planctomycetia bacterium]
MLKHIAAGIAAIGLAMQGSLAWGATTAPPVPPSCMLSPGDYVLSIRLFDDESSHHEEEEVEVVIQRGKVLLKLTDDPQVHFTGQMPLSTLTFRFGDGQDDVVLRGNLTTDDALEGIFVVESFGVGTEHGTFTLKKTGKK